MKFSEWVNRNISRRLLLGAIGALSALLVLGCINLGIAYRKERIQFNTFSEIIGTSIRNHDMQSIQKTALLLLRDLNGKRISLYDNLERPAWAYPATVSNNVYFTRSLEAYVPTVNGDMQLRLELPLIPHQRTIISSIIILILGMALLGWMMRGVIRKLSGQLSDELRKMLHNEGDVFIDEIAEAKNELLRLRKKESEQAEALRKRSEAEAIGQMSSHIAHDMRSPLSVLKTYAGLKTVADEDLDVAELRKSAQRSVGKLERMAVDLVDYAKASKLQRARHQLSGIIYEGSIAEAKKRAEDKGVKIQCAMQGGIRVNVDAYKLERVITNLVNNAVQAIENPSTELPTTRLGASRTGGDGEVSISATTEHNGVLKISVKDNGKGIDPEVLPHIFDSFFTKGKRGGSGLGLAYCKQVVEAHGGTIDVESELGKGSTFTIKIPQCAVEHSMGEVKVKAETQPQSKPAFTNVLIADDDPEILREWQKIIPEHGGTIVHSAKTVKEVEDADLDYSKIDTAIVDYQFYGEDKTGIDLIKHLKAKGVKTVYLCTGFYDNEVIINQAHAAGAVHVLPKPIDVSLLS